MPNEAILTITHFLNSALMIGLPIGLAVFATNKFRLNWRLVWIGAGTFIFSQVFHIPFNSLVNSLIARGILPYPLMPSARMIYSAVFGGLSAGIFEEVSRYIMYRWWAREARTWRQGILAGVGHGGAEAVILGSLTLWTFIRIISLRGVDLSTVFPPSQVEIARQQIAQYWSAPWPLTLLGAVERAFSIVTHICLSVIVLQVFTRKQIRWLWLAIGYHALWDASIAGIAAKLLSAYPWGAYAIEGLLGLTAILSLGIIFALRGGEPLAPIEEELPPLEAPASAPILPPVEESPENLEKSRYN
jgi:uncharacterized membrane protein YhfC